MRWISFFLYTYSSFQFVYGDTAKSAASCRKSLGMHSGAIADDAVTASSSYDSISVGPAFGRYRCLITIYTVSQKSSHL